MTDKEIIAIVQAHIEGKQIQYYDKINHKWQDCSDNAPCWNFSTTMYRVKPEPKVRPYKDQYECWMNMQEHKPLGWLFNTKDHRYCQMGTIDDNTNWKYWLDNYTYVDGSPFGIID